MLLDGPQMRSVVQCLGRVTGKQNLTQTLLVLSLQTEQRQRESSLQNLIELLVIFFGAKRAVK